MSFFSLLCSVFTAFAMFPALAFSYDISKMSVEEKVGQLLMVHFLGTEVNDDAKLLVQKAHVGGIIYFTSANGLTSPEQVKNLSAGLQNLARIPLLIAIDQEGGAVTRLKTGFEIFPSNWATGRTQDPQYAYKVALATAGELKAVGINMNLAPVVDINTNPDNPVIGIRSFGSSPTLVSSFGKAALSGYKEGGVIATLKHFPGHGDVSVDSHFGLPITYKSEAELQACELYPFAKLANDAEVIMTAHLLVPSIDPKKCATFSAPLLQGVLREKLGFTGVIISDSLLMEGALMQIQSLQGPSLQDPNLQDSSLQRKSLENAAIEAFNAGCDLLTIAGGFSKATLGVADTMIKVHEALVQAVLDGRISQTKLHTSLERIVQLKKAHLSINKNNAVINASEHKKLSQDIAKASVQTLYNHLPDGFVCNSFAIISPDQFAVELAQTQMAKQADCMVCYKTMQPTNEEIEHIKDATKSVDVVVVLSAMAWKFPKQVELVKALKQTGKKVILICVGLPQDADVHPQCSACVASFGPSPASLDESLYLVLNLGATKTL